jgi:hypothetical protein
LTRRGDILEYGLTTKMEEFRNDDRGYLNWVARNPRGYVINIQRSLNSSDARLHRADCRTVTGTPPRGRAWTGLYIKICSLDSAALDDWATRQIGTPIKRCGICEPASSRSGATTSSTAARGVQLQRAPRGASALRRRATSPAPLGRDHRWEIRGPSTANQVLEARIDDYIRFERRPPDQEQLRTAIRERLRALDARRDQVLHATFLGAKHPTADVENLALYYIDDTGRSFARAARFGLRFELASVAPMSPTGTEYAYGYRYELAPRRAAFSHWVEGRQLASWDWIDLGGFSGDKKLEQVWLAIARTATAVASSGKRTGSPFAARLVIRPPRATVPALGYLVKGLVDGVVCAFQAHTDRSNLTELATRLSRVIPASPDEIQALLTGEEIAVLGAVPRLLHLRGKGVQWAPADDMCVAGDVLAVQGTTTSWALKGSILELHPS